MIMAGAFLLILGLIVFGPKKTLEMAQTVGRVLAQVKQATNQFQTELQEEVRNQAAGDAGPVESQGSSE